MQTDIATQAKYNATLIFLCDAKPCQQDNDDGNDDC
jgi:hypothetical protein